MAQFTYRAIDKQGVARAGSVESASRGAALQVLEAQGLVPVSVQEGIGASAGKAIRRLRWPDFSYTAPIRAKDVLAMTQSLSALLRAGLTIDRALAMAANLSESRLRQVLHDIGRNVRAGGTFADALQSSTLPLPGYYIGMVQAGEAGGTLPQALHRVSELLQQQHEVRERIRSALIYPMLLAGVVVMTVILLLTFVLPKFQALFSETDAELPFMTRVVLDVGGFVSTYWWLLFGVTFAGVLAGAAYLRTPRGRERIDTWLARSRLTLGLPVAIETARLLRTMGTLLASGVQIGTAMRIGRVTLTNTCLQRALAEAAQRIKAGERPSVALEAVKVFPPLVIQLARVGEETGRLEDMLAEAAAILEVESRTALERLLSLLVPVLTISMGALIATLIGSVLIGLLSVNELAF